MPLLHDAPTETPGWRSGRPNGRLAALARHPGQQQYSPHCAPTQRASAQLTYIVITIRPSTVPALRLVKMLLMSSSRT